MQLVKQTLVSNKDLTQYACVRWDNEKKVLMFQNRSKDQSLSLDDYLDRRNTSINHAKKEGLLISDLDIPINSKWPTLETLKTYFK